MIRIALFAAFALTATTSFYGILWSMIVNANQTGMITGFAGILGGVLLKGLTEN